MIGKPRMDKTANNMYTVSMFDIIDREFQYLYN